MSSLSPHRKRDHTAAEDDIPRFLSPIGSFTPERSVECSGISICVSRDYKDAERRVVVERSARRRDFILKRGANTFSFKHTEAFNIPKSYRRVKDGGAAAAISLLHSVIENEVKVTENLIDAQLDPGDPPGMFYSSISLVHRHTDTPPTRAHVSLAFDRVGTAKQLHLMHLRRSFRSFANDDRHVMAKHASIYPAPEELEAVQTLVSTVEGALKKVSDWMDGLNKSSEKTSTSNGAGDNTVEKDAPETRPDGTPALCGVTRVGLVAKGLLIKGDMDLELVLMCRDKPTKLLLYTISANLPLQIQTMTDDKYEVQSCVPEAAIQVCSTKDPRLTLKITLSSLAMREEHGTTEEEATDLHLERDSGRAARRMRSRLLRFLNVMKDPALCMRNLPALSQKITEYLKFPPPPSLFLSSFEEGQWDEDKGRQQDDKKNERKEEDVLDRQQCQAALASLRHAKWFQARVTDLKSCVIILRIFRDMCNRLTGWQPLKGWPLELICEKAIATCNRPLGPGEALRRVMECIASGILLPGRVSLSVCSLKASESLMSDCCIQSVHRRRGPGIHDPCEREPTDVLSNLTAQQADVITDSAQHALRLLAFGQLYKVLNMDPLPASKPSPRLLEGGCQKRLRDDVGPDDRDFIKRMKGKMDADRCRRVFD
ncbi:hypothetical protein L3Q82_006970 [Scortum barcoo]|uniref:Uncharacterized protein n=1 Tax=Scortum barcoo TaxID=214431 RepID=A0ACB8WX80_9TELE|nr:hypothetical protein L3Q82_006970 [Scortum barcoo]